MLYERARQLERGGASAEEIRRVLRAEGASDEDVTVILGSLGAGPQVQPDPTQKPLAVADRAAESRGLRIVVFVVGAVALVGLLLAVRAGVVLVWAMVKGFTEGR